MWTANMQKMDDWRNDMHLFDPLKARKIGLLQASVYQELIQQESYRWPLDVEHGVIEKDGRRWFRYDDDDLKMIFPYASLSEIKKSIKDLTALHEIDCQTGSKTDYIWIAQRW